MADFCESCGSPLKPGVKFCEACGQPVAGAAAGSYFGPDAHAPNQEAQIFTADTPPEVPPAPQYRPLQNSSGYSATPPAQPYYTPPPMAVSKPASGSCLKIALIVFVAVVAISACLGVVGGGIWLLTNLQ